jgi:hypothetical protein
MLGHRPRLQQAHDRPSTGELLLWLATELCEPRLCFALESSLSGVCDTEIYKYLDEHPELGLA